MEKGKLSPDRIRGFVSVHARLRAPNCLLGYFLGVQQITYSQDAATNFDAKYVKRRSSSQGCAFLGSDEQNLTFTLPFSQKTPILGPILYLEIFSRKTALTLEVLRVNDP